MRLEGLQVILRCKVYIDLRLQRYRVGVQSRILKHRQTLLSLESSKVLTNSTSDAYLIHLQGSGMILRFKVCINLRLHRFRVRVQTYTLEHRQTFLSLESSNSLTNSTSAVYLIHR